MSRSRSAILVGQIAALTATLEIRCSRCDRHGELSTQGIMRDLGPNAPIWKAWADLNADCPSRRPAGTPSPGTHATDDPV